MICIKCGSKLADGARFCGQCGTPVSNDTFCPSCGGKLQSGQVFCTSCGMKLEKEISFERPVSKGEGKLLKKIHGVTKFEGKPAMGLANKVGVLTIYDNRVEFVRRAGLTLAATVSSMASSHTEAYYLGDMSSITTGNYLGAYTTLVLNLKNGNTVSFCPSAPLSQKMVTVANLLLHYL